MLSLRRLQAMVLLVAVLVVSVWMFPTPAFSDDCDDLTDLCCAAILMAQVTCQEFGFGALPCELALAVASGVCAAAADECGSNVAHNCFGG